MEPKTAWEHLLGEPVIRQPGEPPMKAEIDAKFEGSFAQFCAWMEETFKNPGDMRLRVMVGGLPPVRIVAVPHVPSVRTIEGAALMEVAPSLKRQEAEAVVVNVHKLLKGRGNAPKIEAIKALREVTPLGLKEAKDFVESLPTGELASLTPESREPEDIPF